MSQHKKSEPSNQLTAAASQPQGPGGPFLPFTLLHLFLLSHTSVLTETLSVARKVRDTGKRLDSDYSTLGKETKKDSSRIIAISLSGLNSADRGKCNTRSTMEPGVFSAKAHFFIGMIMAVMLIPVMSIQIGQMWPTRTSKRNAQTCKYCEIKLAFTETTVSAIDTNPIYLQKVFKGWKKMNQKVETTKTLTWLLYSSTGLSVKKVSQYTNEGNVAHSRCSIKCPIA